MYRGRGGGKRGHTEASIPTIVKKSTTTSNIPEIVEAMGIEDFDIKEWLGKLNSAKLQDIYLKQQLNNYSISCLNGFRSWKPSQRKPRKEETMTTTSGLFYRLLTCIRS